MVRPCVRVYIEGGAEGKTADSDFRRGWKKFLSELHELARSCGYHGLEVVRGKGRANTFRSFTRREIRHPKDLCVLLVDAEVTVREHDGVWDIVGRRKHDNWRRPGWATERHLYLMVHFVETWLLTDRDALQTFFQEGFNPRSLPERDLEDRSKDDINRSLAEATRYSRKGPYRHGQAHEIIGLVRPDRVKTLRHGYRLFNELSNLIRDEAGG